MINKLKNKISNDFHLKELINGATINFLIQIIGILFGYFVIFIVSYFYGAKGLGIFTLTLAVVNIFILIGKGGFDTSIVKFISENIDSKQINIYEIYKSIMYISIPVNILLTLLMFFLSPYITQYIFSNEQLTLYFQIMSLAILPISLRSINANAIRGLKNIKLYSLLQNVFVHMFFIIGILVINTYSSKIMYLLTAYIFSVWIVFVISSLRWYRNVKNNLIISLTKIKIKDILKVSLPMLLTSSLILIITWTDSIMIGIICSEKEVGLYTASMKIATASLIILMAFNSIFAPKIAQAYGNKDIKTLKSFLSKTNKLVIMISIPYIILLILVTPYLLIYFGVEFKDAYNTFLILMTGMIFRVIFGTSEYVLQMTNMQKVVAKYSFIGVTINIVLNTVFISKLGINGAALASALSIITMQLLFYVKVKKILNTNIYIKREN